MYRVDQHKQHRYRFVTNSDVGKPPRKRVIEGAEPKKFSALAATENRLRAGTREIEAHASGGAFPVKRS